MLACVAKHHGPGALLQPGAAPGSLTETSDTSELRPYFSRFGFTQDLTFYHNGFDTNYNALQVSYEKRFSQGLQLNANFAFQRGYNYGNDEEVYKKFLWGRLDDLREKQLTRVRQLRATLRQGQALWRRRAHVDELRDRRV